MNCGRSSDAGVLLLRTHPHFQSPCLVQPNKIRERECLVEEWLGRLIQPEVHKPAIVVDCLHVVVLEVFGSLWPDVQIDTPVSVVLEIFHTAVEIDAADLGAAIVVRATRVFAIKREGPELFTGTSFGT